MKKKQDGNFQFEVGDKALDHFNTEVTIIKKALRSEVWEYREQYLVEYRYKSMFGNDKVKQEWILQRSLTKLI